MEKRLTYSGGYTLVEIMMAQALIALALLAACSFYLDASKSWKIADVEMDTSYEASQALERIIYGIGPNSGIRSAGGLEYTSSGSGWELTITGGQTTTITYDAEAGTLTYSPGDKIICRNVDDATATLENNGVTLSVTVEKTVGAWSRKRTMTTFVALRNAGV